MKDRCEPMARWMKGVAPLALCLALCLAGAQAFAESGVSVTVTPGANWKEKVVMGIVPMTKTPQYAAWIETPDGKYVETVMVTSPRVAGHVAREPERRSARGASRVVSRRRFRGRLADRERRLRVRDRRRDLRDA